MKKLIVTTIALAFSMCVLECSAGDWSELRAVKRDLALRRAVKTKPFTGTNEFGRTFWEQCQFEARAKAKQDFIRKYSTGKDDYGRSFEERETIASCFDLEEFFGFRFGDALAVETTNSLTRPFRIFKSAVLVPTCMGRLGEVYLQCNTTNVTMKSLKQEAMHVAILMEMKHGVELVKRYEGRNLAAMSHEDWLRYVFENDNVKMEVELLYENARGLYGNARLMATVAAKIRDCGYFPSGPVELIPSDQVEAVFKDCGIRNRPCDIDAEWLAKVEKEWPERWLKAGLVVKPNPDEPFVQAKWWWAMNLAEEAKQRPRTTCSCSATLARSARRT